MNIVQYLQTIFTNEQLTCLSEGDGDDGMLSLCPPVEEVMVVGEFIGGRISVFVDLRSVGAEHGVGSESSSL